MLFYIGTIVVVLGGFLGGFRIILGGFLVVLGGFMLVPTCSSMVLVSFGWFCGDFLWFYGGSVCFCGVSRSLKSFLVVLGCFEVVLIISVVGLDGF